MYQSRYPDYMFFMYDKKENTYITSGVGSHNGGVWKMADSSEDLDSKSTRMGTYDADLVKIGD